MTSLVAVRSRVIRWFAVAALTLVLGAHWAVLQSIAWVTMAVGYSQTGPLKEALVKTFDGKHPCQLCKLVADGKKSQQRQDAPTRRDKLDLFLVKRSVAIYPPPTPLMDPAISVLPDSHTDSPPTPPPRAA